MPRELGGAHRPARNGLAVEASDQKSLFAACEGLPPLRSDRVNGRKRPGREDGGAALVRRERDVDRHELLDVLLARLANLEAFGDADLRVPRNLAHPMPLLMTEAQAKPRVDELRIVARHQRVMTPPLLLEPACRCRCVQIA